MGRTHWVVLALALTACPERRSPQATPPPSKEPEELAKISDLEDRRALADGNLFNWALTHPEPQVRARAYLALGRVQDPSAIDTVLKGFTDPAPAVRTEAAFASGLIGLAWHGLTDVDKLKLSDGLRSVEQTEPDPKVHDAILEALGRVGTSGAVDRLNERLTVTELQGRAALAMGVAFRRGAKFPASSTRVLTGLLAKENSQPTRYGAAFAFSTSKDTLARPALRSCASDDSSEIRAVCVKGLGDVGEDVDAVLLKQLIDDPDYRVAVEAVRALAKLSTRCKSLVCPPLGALADLSSRTERLQRGDTIGGGQVLLALAQQGVPTVGVPVLLRVHEQLVRALSTQADPKIKKDLGNLECRFAVAIDKAEAELNLSPGCGGGTYPDTHRFALMLSEIAETTPRSPKKRFEQVAPYLDHPDARVKLAAIQALASSKWPAALDKLRPLLASPDLVLAAATAKSLATLQDKQSLTLVRGLATKCLTNLDAAPDVAEALGIYKSAESTPELQAWLQSPHTFLRHSAADLLTQITGKPVVAPLIEYPKEEKKGSMPKDATLTLKTERGEIVIKFLTADAPRTAASIYTLARKNYFKGQTIHRVVPDFVAQGGDPRGDGNGGPGYSLRCEVNHHPYGRGAVGMALSGKDTGGSQFFFTLSPQPHLEGRYTVFGEVVKGQEIADALLEDDLILDARAAP